MATGCYVGVNGVREIKSLHVGVVGTVKKVKAIYMGVNGAVKKVWSATVPGGQVVFTSSQTWTVPEGVRAIDVFCVGGGAAGSDGTGLGGGGGVVAYASYGGDGGSSGFTKTAKNIQVNPGQQIAVTIGAGGNSSVREEHYGGKTMFGNYCTAESSNSNSSYNKLASGGSGGGGGSEQSYYYYNTSGTTINIFLAHAGASDGANGLEYRDKTGTVETISYYGQGTTTRLFGESNGTLYAGGGGGGTGHHTRWGVLTTTPLFGGSGGGGAGGICARPSSGGDIIFNPTAGTPNTGSGGGGGAALYSGASNNSTRLKDVDPANGGSGICIIRWSEQ